MNISRIDFFDFVESNYNIYDTSSLKEIQRLKDIVNTDKMNWKPNMTLKYLYNKLIKLARNKTLYKDFENQDQFSDRLIFFLLHFALFFKVFKNSCEL